MNADQIVPGANAFLNGYTPSYCAPVSQFVGSYFFVASSKQRGAIAAPKEK
jgi:hypothetical protein